MLTWGLESGQFSLKNNLFYSFVIDLCTYACFVYLQPFCVTVDFKTIHLFDPYPV